MVTLTLVSPEQPALDPFASRTEAGAATHSQQWEFKHQAIIRVGRAPDNDIVLGDALVSRYHLELHKIDHSTPLWQLINQGKNGTFVDGILVSQGIVQDGALIQLAQGGPTLKFHQTTATLHLPANSVPPNVNPFSVTCHHTDNPPGNLFCSHCGYPLTVQRVVRQYHILQTLGQGGMGTTYLAWDREKAIAQRQGHCQTAPLLVLKEMNADMAQIAKAQELFEREARTLQMLSHPGVPRFYDFFIEAGKKYLVMELIHGQDLEKRIRQKGPVLPRQAIEWMLQTCEVLDYLHHQDPPMIHRDIKPANLLVRSADNRIVVLDFGAVKEMGKTSGTRIGAEGYSAPEQERGHPLIQSDLYAIGPTLIFLLTAESPQRFYQRQGKGYGFNLDGIPTITPQLRSVITCVTRSVPGDRYQTAKELAQALTQCL